MLVVAATSDLGGRVVRELPARNTTVRALARNAEKGRDLRQTTSSECPATSSIRDRSTAPGGVSAVITTGYNDWTA